MGVAYQKFCGETFVGGYKIAKFMKVFSLESFPLYGSCSPVQLALDWHGQKRHTVGCLHVASC